MPFPEAVNIQAEVFASVPENLRRTGQVPEWAVINRHGAPVDCFLEGPAFDAAGNLYIVDIAWGRIFKVSPAGDMTVVAEYDGEPNGMKVMADGSLMVADYKHGLMAIDPSTGTVSEHCTRYRLERFKGVNDLTVAADGAIWFTDQGQTGLQDPSGRIFRLAPNGDLSLVLDGIPSPNGLVLSPDERILYIGVTRGNAVWRMPIMPDGGPSKVGIFVQLIWRPWRAGWTGPDGRRRCRRRPCRARVHMDILRNRRTALPRPMPPRPDDHQHRLRRPRHARHVHHRIRHRPGAESPPAHPRANA